jgi:hypothetical protein
MTASDNFTIFEDTFRFVKRTLSAAAANGSNCAALGCPRRPKAHKRHWAHTPGFGDEC